ncbi:MAG: 3-isopropylmalate dehydratase small subunit [Bacteroidota bacterium]
MTKFSQIKSRVVSLPINDIDTDQIIPASFLKGTDKSGLAAGLFAGWRYFSDGSPKPDFVLNKPEVSGAQILLVGNNFGCGSSREHAAWALRDFGFRAFISTSFADIFRNNSIKNGLLPVEVGAPDFRRLIDLIAHNPEAEVEVDLALQEVRLPEGKPIPFPIDSFSKYCLLTGMDELDYILSFAAEISAYEGAHR